MGVELIPLYFLLYAFFWLVVSIKLVQGPEARAEHSALIWLTFGLALIFAVPFFMSLTSYVDYSIAVELNQTLNATARLNDINGITTATASGHFWAVFVVAMYFITKLIQTAMELIQNFIEWRKSQKKNKR